MVARSFFAIDNNNLIVDSSSNGSIVGNPVINNSDTPNGTVFTYSAGGGTTVTIDDTGGDPDIFEDDNTAGHSVTDGGGIVSNGTPVEAESLIFVRALDINGNPTGPTITITVFSQNGVTGNVWGFSPDIELQDGVQYEKNRRLQHRQLVLQHVYYVFCVQYSNSDPRRRDTNRRASHR